VGPSTHSGLPRCPGKLEADEALFIPCDRAGTIEVHVEHVDVHRKGCSNSVIEAMMNRELPPAWAGLIPVNEVARRSVQHVIALGDLKELTGKPGPRKTIEYINVCNPRRPEPVVTFKFICRPLVLLLDKRIMPDPALAKTIQGIARHKRRIEEIEAEKSDVEHQMLLLKDRQKRIKANNSSEPFPDGPTGSSHDRPIDLTGPSSGSGSTRELPIDLTTDQT